MNRVKIVKLIEAARDENPVEVKRITASIIAEKVKKLIDEKKKTIVIK